MGGGEPKPITTMKTVLIILVTLFVSQQVYRLYGPNNLINRTTDTCRSAVHWVFHSASHLTK